MTKPAALPTPLYVRLLAVAMSCVICGLGLLALFTGHAPERWTQHGHTGPLSGETAQAFGLSIFFFGLLPLMLAMRSAKAAAWLGAVAGTLGLVAVFVGPKLFA